MYGGGGIVNKFGLIEGDDQLHFDQGLKRYVLAMKLDGGIEIKNVRLGISYSQDLTSYSVLNEKLSTVSYSINIRFGGSKAYIRKRT